MSTPPRMRTVVALAVALLAPFPVLADPLADAVADFRAGRYAEAAPALEALARAGRPEAQFWLGTMYYQGRGKPRLYRAAARWYRRAAETGHADAQNNLGLMRRNGEAMEVSRPAAYAWFSLAAAQGNAVARSNLAVGMAPGEIVAGQRMAEECAARIEVGRRRPRSPRD